MTNIVEFKPRKTTDEDRYLESARNLDNFKRETFFKFGTDRGRWPIEYRERYCELNVQFSNAAFRYHCAMSPRR